MKKLWLLCLGLSPMLIKAQGLELFSGAGYLNSKGDFQISATIGEPFVLAQVGQSLMITEGFQQAEPLPPLVGQTDRGAPAQAWAAALSPNPAAQHINISLQHASGPYKLRLHSAQGRLMHEARMSDAHYRLDLAGISDGQYWITLVSVDSGETISLPFSKIDQ